VVVPPALDSLTAEQSEVYRLFPANLTQYLLLTNESAEPYMRLGFSFRSVSISDTDRETVILRIGCLRRCAYELMQHIDIARRAGVEDAVIANLICGATSYGEPRIDRLVAYVDAALTNQITPQIMSDLALHYDDTQIAEIALLTGHYMMTAIFLQSLDVPLDANPTAWPGELPS
jgi:alkylhydroperoxidase family enzyme